MSENREDSEIGDRAGTTGVPTAWLAARDALPAWAGGQQPE
jgi:hypothetical protein